MNRRPRLCFYLILTACLELLSLTVHGADTIKIHLTYRHHVNENNQTRGYATINQKFYTPDDTLFREIRYDETSGQISGYTFYFYKDGRLFSEEFHLADDVLDYVIIHEYGPEGNHDGTKKLSFDKGIETLEIKEIRKFNQYDLVSREKLYVGKKLGYTLRYTYDRENKLAKQTCKYKTAFDTTIKNETRIYQYNPSGQTGQIIISGKNLINQSYEFRESYEYNDEGLLTNIKTFDKNGQLTKERIFKYLNSGALSIYQENDGEGNILLLLQYDYKKHFMDIGIQRSAISNN